MKKLKPCGSNFHPIYSINSRYSIKVQELTDLLTIPIIIPLHREFQCKIPIWTRPLRPCRDSQSEFRFLQRNSAWLSMRTVRSTPIALKISQAVLSLGKLPDDFTQADVDDYLTMLLDRNCYSLSFFKHSVFGLKDYYKYMGLKEPGGLDIHLIFVIAR